MSEQSAADSELLRAEIATKRAELGETVEALTAKLDVPARAKGAATDLVGRVSGAVRVGASSVRDSYDDADIGAAVRKPLPIVGLAVTAALVGRLTHRRRAE